MDLKESFKCVSKPDLNKDPQAERSPKTNKPNLKSITVRTFRLHLKRNPGQEVKFTETLNTLLNGTETKTI